VQLLHRAITATWQSGTAPPAWKAALLTPLHKKGERLQPSNYRPISLLDVTGKVYVNVLHNRIRAQLNSLLLEAQHGFRPGRGTGEALFSLRRVTELARDFGKPMYAAFVDLKAAFDSVNRPALWRLLQARGVAPKLVELITDLYEGGQVRVAAGGCTSAPFQVHTGVRQGCPMSPTLFNTYMDFIARLTAAQCQQQGVRGYGFAYRVNGQLVYPPHAADKVAHMLMLLYADDLVLMAADSSELARALSIFEATAAVWGLQLNYAKTKAMVLSHESRMPPQPPPIQLQHGQVQYTSEFVYLGSKLGGDGSQQAELDRRLLLAGAAFRRLQPAVFKPAHLSTGTKMRIYKASVLPVLVYGAAESWAPTKTQLHRDLDVFNTTRLRVITGTPMMGPDTPSNESLYQKTKQPAISAMLRTHRLRWLGHMARMSEDRLAKQLLFATAPRSADGPWTRARIQGGPAQTWNRLARSDLRDMQGRADTEDMEDIVQTGQSEAGWFEACQNKAEWEIFASSCSTLG
jgi:hypothetical protein